MEMLLVTVGGLTYAWGIVVTVSLFIDLSSVLRGKTTMRSPLSVRTKNICKVMTVMLLLLGVSLLANQ